MPVAAGGQVLPLPDAPPEPALVPEHVPELASTIHACLLIAYWPALHFRQPGEGNSNRAKLGPEQGTKQPIPPTFIKN